ncbi:MAG: hypothetical protein PW786_01565 [Arachidicoccus sp.]|nr:hypothetical protein [Arachidicoccus sp.]
MKSSKRKIHWTTKFVSNKNDIRAYFNALEENNFKVIQHFDDLTSKPNIPKSNGEKLSLQDTNLFTIILGWITILFGMLSPINSPIYLILLSRQLKKKKS